MTGSTGSPRPLAQTRTCSGAPFFTVRRKRSVSSGFERMPLTATGVVGTFVSAAPCSSSTLGNGLERRESGSGDSPACGNVPAACGTATVCDTAPSGSPSSCTARGLPAGPPAG